MQCCRSSCSHIAVLPELMHTTRKPQIPDDAHKPQIQHDAHHTQAGTRRCTRQHTIHTRRCTPHTSHRRKNTLAMCVHACACMHVRACMCVRASVSLHACVCVSVCVCVCVCVLGACSEVATRAARSRRVHHTKKHRQACTDGYAGAAAIMQYKNVPSRAYMLMSPQQHACVAKQPRDSIFSKKKQTREQL